MLATLKGQSVFGIPTGENRLFSLLRPPMLTSNTFGDCGQGPEKPIIEEVDIEEEVFTFPYPEEEGEISDILNPPITGIVGKVLNTKSKVDNLLVITTDFSNVFSYLFFDSSLERPTRSAKPEFVSLTRQSEIAGSYRDLLVYSSYTASNANFSYTSDNVYERVDTPTNTLYSRESTPFYETKFPMPMIFKMVYYDAKKNNEAYIKPLLQAKLQHYQNVTHEEINVQPVNTQVIDITPNNNVPDLNCRLNLKLDYEAPKLELPLVKDELPILDLNIKSDENKTVILPLCKPSHNVRDLVVPVTLPRLNTVVVPKYDEARVKYEAAKNIVNLPVNLGFDDTLLRDRFIERLNTQVKESGQWGIKLPSKLKVIDSRIPRETYTYAQDENGVIRDAGLLDNANVKSKEVKLNLMEGPAFQYDTRVLDFSLDNRPIVYDGTKVSLDPYTLFNLRSNETQTNYQHNLEVRNVLLPDTEYKSRDDLDNLVSVNYDNGRALSLPRTNATSSNYNLPLADFRLQVGTETVPISDSNYERTASKLDLEEAVERELIEEEQNIQSEVYEGDIAQGEVYEKNELQEEQETKTNESTDSSLDYLAAAAGVVGLSVLAGATDLVGVLLKKDNDEEINPNKPNEELYKSKEGEVKKNCSDKSQCFADAIEWLEGKLKNPTFSDEEYGSFSQCYSKEIKNVQKAREYTKKREKGHSCNGVLHNLFYHISFTTEQEKKYKLRDYVRDGEVQEGFKLATTIIVGDDIKGDYDIESIWTDDERGGQSEKVTLKKNSAYAQLDISLRKQGYTPIWKMMSYIDTDTGEKRSGLYLETIAEFHVEAKELLGDKDEYGMKLMGIILLINGQEPGQGTISMHNYPIKLSDRIDVVFKNDSVRYNNNSQLISNEEMKLDSDNYPKTEKYNKRLEPILV